jgi:hypothetical protein
VSEGTDGSLTAHFGYTNSGNDVGFAKGPDNFFSPPPEDRGQPAIFVSGTVNDAVVTSCGVDGLTWTVCGHSATASRQSPRCTSAPPPCTSCSQCRTIDLTQTSSAITSAFTAQVAAVSSVLDALDTSGQAGLSAFIADARAQLEQIQQELLDRIATIPASISSCATSDCAQLDAKAFILALRGLAQDLGRLHRRAAIKGLSLHCNVASNELLRAATLLRAAQAAVQTIPRFLLDCH